MTYGPIDTVFRGVATGCVLVFWITGTGTTDMVDPSGEETGLLAGMFACLDKDQAVHEQHMGEGAPINHDFTL